MKKLVLKPGREKSVLGRHPWIFSGAVKEIDSFSNGDILQVFDSHGHLLGSGYCNKKSQIVCRMLAYGAHDPIESLRERIRSAIQLRRSLVHKDTNAYRLVHAEGDFLPGLIIDKFNDVLVVQIGTLGMNKLKQHVVNLLAELESPAWIYEKSQASSRTEEGLKPLLQTLYGKEQSRTEIRENGLRFWVDIVKGQKTGFFLDQQAMRALVESLSRGKRVLNCFSYTGGFSLYALRGGAVQCDSVDIAAEAVQMTRENIVLNDMERFSHREIAEDVFTFLRNEKLDYELIILDPPAFAKRKSDVAQALRGYRDINRIAMEKIVSGGLLLTASCSYHVDDMLFRKMLFQAACEANRNVRILETHRQSYDHPQSIYCPESSYLKGYLLHVS